VNQKPIVYIVGAGPGDPDMLTVKALRLIQSAEVVIIDRLVSAEIQALVNQDASIIYVGKVPGMHCVPQDEINEILVNQARSGRQVVRLKGGDPYVFGRGSEEAEYLVRNNVAFEIVPGISAASGCTKAAGIPLTHRDLATGVQFVTGHRLAGKDLDHNWQNLADPNTTLVIYMGLSNIGTITENLIKAGLPASTPAAAIENGSTKDIRTCFTTLDNLHQRMEQESFKNPTLFVIGRVVNLAAILNAEETQPENTVEFG